MKNFKKYHQEGTFIIIKKLSHQFMKDVHLLMKKMLHFSSIKCFKYLLMNGANLSNTGKYAVAGGNDEIIHLCEQNHSSFEGAYEAAIKFHKNDIFYYLYENKIKEIGILKELGKICIIYHNYEILLFLIENGITCFKYLIIISLKIGNIFILRYFLKINPTTLNICDITSIYNNEEIFNYLINENIFNINKVNNDGIPLLIFAIENDKSDLVKILLQKGIDVNAKSNAGKKPLILAIEKGRTEIVKLLLEQEGIDINAKDKNGKTAHILASQNGHTEIVKLLLEQKGIDINAKDNWENTALICASKNGHTEIVTLLLQQKGIDINAADHYEQTALYWAVKKGKIEVVQLLLELNVCDINVKDINGWTPLMQASKKGFTEIVKLLVEQKGIDITIKNKDGQTALMLATTNHKLLKKRK